MEATILEQLKEARTGVDVPSRKNKVFPATYEGRSVFVKVFNSTEIALKERAILLLCREKGIDVPEPLHLSENILVLESIDGESGQLIFESCMDRSEEEARLKTCLDELAGWLWGLHSKLGIRRGDCIPKNFIFSNKVYGLDFEESGEGDTLRDVGDMCGFILRWKPDFTVERFHLARRFGRMYFQYAREERWDELSVKVCESFEHYAQFASDPTHILLWADKLREKGLTKL